MLNMQQIYNDMVVSVIFRADACAF